MDIGNRVRHTALGWGLVVGFPSPDAVLVRLDGTTPKEETVKASELYCPEDHEHVYAVVRFYQRGGRRTIETRLTLPEARAHCSDPETSSSTATSSKARARTRRMGPWFDGYERRG